MGQWIAPSSPLKFLNSFSMLEHIVAIQKTSSHSDVKVKFEQHFCKEREWEEFVQKVAGLVESQKWTQLLLWNEGQFWKLSHIIRQKI